MTAVLQKNAKNLLTATAISAFLALTPAGKLGAAPAFYDVVAPIATGVVATDTANLQAAIDATPAGGSLFIPRYRYSHSGLTRATNISIFGGGLTFNMGSPSGNDVPVGSPALSGCVLVCDSNGNNSITVSGVATQINMANIGFEFATPFIGTGDHFNYIPTGTNTGLANPYWQNVGFYGHDGNHIAINLQNPLLGAFIDVNSWGGGVIKIVGNGTTNYGNLTFVQLYGNLVTGGTAHGVDLSASVLQKLNLITFVRPQIMVTNHSGVSTGNPPTSAQYIWKEDTNVTNITGIGEDYETNVGSKLLFGPAANGIKHDFASMFTTAASIESAAWGVYGRIFNGQGIAGRNFKDITSAGATGDTSMFFFPGSQISATNPTTFSVLATAYFAPPTQGINVTATKLRAIYATGAIETTSSLTGVGLSISGAANINIGSGAATQIGNGSGTVGVGVAASANASLTLAASTTARGSMQWVAGVAPTTPADGVEWFDGTNKFMRVSGVTKTYTWT